MVQFIMNKIRLSRYGIEKIKKKIGVQYFSSNNRNKYLKINLKLKK